MCIRDSYRSDDGATAAGGSGHSIRTRDNSGATSAMTSNTFDCANAQEIMIDFWYLANSMESGEDFYLEYSNDGGTNYTTIQQWVAGQDFSNGTEYNESVTFTEIFTSNCKLRLRCDASSNADQVYFDNVRIKICEGGTAPPACDPVATICNTGTCPIQVVDWRVDCLLYTSPSPRDRQKSRMPSSA